MSYVSIILLLCLMCLLGLSVWWAYTEREVYRNRVCGESFRTGIIRHARALLQDENATETTRAVATFWLAQVYDSSSLLEIANSPIPGSPLKRGDSWIEMSCGQHATVVRDGFAHLSVLAVLENRRLGSAMRTLIRDAAMPASVKGLRRLSLKRMSDAQQSSQPHWIRGSLEVVRNLEFGKKTTRILCDRALEIA